MIVLALLACAREIPPDAPAPGLPDGWTLGEVQACEATGGPTWTEDPTAPEVYAPKDVEGHEPGGVGVVDVAGTPWLLWIPPEGPLRARPLLGGETREVGTEPVTALTQADLDGDGAMDLVLPHRGVTIVWAFGTPDEDTSTIAATPGENVRDVGFLDVDADGDLDLVLSYAFPDITNIEALRAEVLPNRGNRRFGAARPVEAEDTFWGPNFDLTVVDVDADGVPEVYLCNDLGRAAAPNGLLGVVDGALVPVDAHGLDVRTNCMGSAWGDLDADGILDVYLGAAGEQVLLQAMDGAWWDVAAARGLPPLPYPEMAWGSALEDLDNDGHPDLLVATSDFLGAEMFADALWWMRQGDDGAMVEEGAARGLPTEAYTRGVLAWDLDGDGVLDLVVGDALRSPWIWWSDGCADGAWLTVDAPVGSHVVVRAGDRAWATEVTTDASWASTGPPRAHVGLGDRAEVDAIEITPPWGETVTLPGPIATRRVVTWRP